MHETQPSRDEQWGLPPEMLLEMEAELDDHAACEAELRLPAPSMVNAEAAAALPRREIPAGVIRGLGSVYSLDQLAEQVLRLPKWPGLLGMLAAAAGLLTAIAGDAVAAQPSPVAAWLLQGGGIGLFAAGAAYTLQRGWLTGPGVMLARWLQLSLLLSCALTVAMHVHAALPAVSSRSALLLWSGLPPWLSSPIILCGLAACAALLLLLDPRRMLPFAFGLFCAGLALYPGGPWPVRAAQWQSAAALDQPAVTDAWLQPNVAAVPGGESLYLDSLVPVEGSMHRLSKFSSGLYLTQQPGNAGSSAVEGQVSFSSRQLLLPVPVQRQALLLLTVLVPAAALLGLAVLCLLLRVYPHPLGGRALVLACTACAVCIAPYAFAGLALPDKLLRAADFTPLLLGRFLHFAHDPEFSGLFETLLLGSNLGLLLGLRLVRRRRTQTPPAVLNRVRLHHS